MGGNSLEGNIVGCEAVNSLQVFVIDPDSGIGSEGHILIIVEGDHILIRVRSNSDLLGFAGNGGIANDRLGGFDLRHGIEGSAVHDLGVQQGTVPHVPDGVAQVIPDAPGAGEYHVLAWHGEAIVRNCHIGRRPPAERIAGHAGHSRHRHGAAHLVRRGGRHRGCTCRRAFGVCVAYREFVLLPYRVEVIRANVVYAHLGVSIKLRSRCFRLSRPADAFVAIPFRQTCCAVSKHGHLLVVLQGIIGLRHIRVEVGVIGESHRRSLATVNRIQLHIGRGNAHLVARVIAGAGAVGLCIPIQEHLTLGGGHASGSLNVGIAALGVLPAVRGCSAGAAIQEVGHTKALGAGVVGIQLDVAVNAGIEVEGGVHIVAFGARADAPAAPGIALGNSHSGQRTLVNGLAVCDHLSSKVAAGNQLVRLSFIGGGRPLGIDGNVVRRHCTVEVEGLSNAFGIVIPSSKAVFRRYSFGAIRRKRFCTRYVCFILVWFLVYNRATIIVDYLIVVTGIVEIRTVVRIVLIRVYTLISYRAITIFIFVLAEASDIIKVFLRNSPSGSGNDILVMFIETHIVEGSTSGFAIQNLDHVMCFTYTLIPFIRRSPNFRIALPPEFIAANGHSFDESLIRTSFLGCRPVAARPLSLDVCAMFCKNGFECNPFFGCFLNFNRFIALIIMRMFFCTTD